jgi:hypothetical protein
MSRAFDLVGPSEGSERRTLSTLISQISQIPQKQQSFFVCVNQGNLRNQCSPFFSARRSRQPNSICPGTPLTSWRPQGVHPKKGNRARRDVVSLPSVSVRAARAAHVRGHLRQVFTSLRPPMTPARRRPSRAVVVPPRSFVARVLSRYLDLPNDWASERASNRLRRARRRR